MGFVFVAASPASWERSFVARIPSFRSAGSPRSTSVTVGPLIFKAGGPLVGGVKACDGGSTARRDPRTNKKKNLRCETRVRHFTDTDTGRFEVSCNIRSPDSIAAPLLAPRRMLSFVFHFRTDRSCLPSCRGRGGAGCLHTAVPVVND